LIRPDILQYNPKMSVTRIVGVLLLVAGIVLIIVGVVASRSLADSLSSVFRGRLTHQTMWYIFGGIASAVVGLLLTLGVIGRSRS
jgi:type II secretory pathway component PulK